MKSITPRVMSLALVVIVCAAFVGTAVSGGAPVARSAASHSVSVKTTAFCKPFPACSSKGVNGKAVYKGAPFGTCSATSKLVLPNIFATWKCKGGGFKVVSKNTSGASNNAAGTWTVTKGSGTGKYKGLSGGGKFKGKISTGLYTFTGTVKY
jgi:hypothetical protein